MARRKVDEGELLVAVEELLERGYSGYHVGALSEKLGVGRSTIKAVIDTRIRNNDNSNNLLVLYSNTQIRH